MKELKSNVDNISHRYHLFVWIIIGRYFIRIDTRTHTHHPTHTHLLFEELALLGRQRVRLGDEGDDVDFVVEPLHELDVQRLQTGGGGGGGTKRISWWYAHTHTHPHTRSLWHYRSTYEWIRYRSVYVFCNCGSAWIWSNLPESN